MSSPPNPSTPGAALIIRIACPADAHAIAAVHVLGWQAAYAGIVPAAYLSGLSLAARTERWHGILTGDRSGFTLVAEALQTGVIGFVSGGPERTGDTEYPGEFYAIYLAPDHKRQGIGVRLMEAAAQTLIEREFDRAMLWTLAQNPSRGFYDALGGQVVRKRAVEIGGVVLPEVAYGWQDLHALAHRCAELSRCRH